VSAGLLAAGSVLLGTVEQCARLLERLVRDPEGVQAAARREAEACKAAGTRISGFGHPWHYPVDPRTPRLFALARELGLPCTYVDAAEILSTEVDAVYGRHLTMNASTAFAALLKEIDIPVEIMRGFVLVARTASLVAHLYEEQRDRSAWTMMKACEEAVPYRTE
jgi:citrate synthase